jgi:hypothetical protein
MWKQKIKRHDTGWHLTQSLRMQFLEHWYDRFRRCTNQFVYTIEVSPYINQSGMIEYEALQINGHCPIEWLKANARGRVAVVASYTEHTTVAIQVAAGMWVTRNLLFTVNFSDPSLALQWKLTWGGKVIDGRKMSLSLNI